MKRMFVAAAVMWHLLAGAQTSEAPERLGLARLTDTNVLLTNPNPLEAKFVDCQPLKGAGVAILKITKGIDGNKGLDAARVQVVDGHCRGTEGWVGIPRLEMLPSAQR